MPVLAFANLKGGVAKTSNAVALAETLAQRGFRVLVIDADHQCTSSDVLLGEHRMLAADEREKTLHDLLGAMISRRFDETTFESYVIRDVGCTKEIRAKLAVLPCSVRIDEFEISKKSAKKQLASGEFPALWRTRRVQMRRWLRASFDYVIIDCPPSLSKYVQFLLRISDGIVVPAIPDRLSLRGAIHFQKRLKERKIKTRVLGTLWTLYRQQVETHRLVIEMFGRKEADGGAIARPFRTVIPNTSALAAAHEHPRHVASLSSKYTPAFAALYEELCDEIRARFGSERPGAVQRELRKVS